MDDFASSTEWHAKDKVLAVILNFGLPSFIHHFAISNFVLSKYSCDYCVAHILTTEAFVFTCVSMYWKCMYENVHLILKQPVLLKESLHYQGQQAKQPNH